MRFVPFSEVQERLTGKRVAIVGSAPSVLGNEPRFIDSHDLVVRVNNFQLSPQAGYRADVHYSFYGASIRKSARELQDCGVSLCLCKCPDAQPIESEWHRRNGKENGVNFRYIYRDRVRFWFTDTYVPTTASFLEKFELLGKRIPTTGFAAILDVLACSPASVFLTGFDFFTSGVHNVTERWTPGNPDDPIGHRPELELAWLAGNASRYPITLDAKLTRMVRQAQGRAVA